MRPFDTLADSLYYAGAYDLLLSFALHGIDAAHARGDSVQLGRMLVYRGRARLILRLPQARSDFSEAIDVATAAGDSLGWSLALGFEGLVALLDGQLDDSIALNERRLEIARALGQPHGPGWAHMLIAYASLMQGKLARAEREYREAAAIFDAAGRPRDVLEARVGLGRVHTSAGRIVDARTAFREALDIARELRDRRQEADCWNNLGTLELERGELALAAQYFRRSYDIKRAEGTYDISNPAGNVALANTLVGRYAAAESVLVDAVQLARDWNEQLSLGGLYGTLGELRLAQARPRSAAEAFRRVLALGDACSVEDRLGALAGLSEALARQDSIAAALGVFPGRAADVLGMPPSLPRCDVLIAWSRCLRAAGGAERAAGLAGAAFDDATTRDDANSAVRAALEISAARRELGDAAGAFTWFDRARATFRANSGRGDEYQWREAYRSALTPDLVSGARVLLEEPPGADARTRERALFDFLQELRARTLIERIRDPRRETDGAKRGATVTADDLQRTILGDGECLLDISVGRGLFYVFAVTRDTLRLSVVDDADGATENRARRFIGLVSRPGGGRVVADAGLADVLAGVADILAGASSIVVAADGWAASLPFAALSIDGRTALIDRHDVSSVPAASLLEDLRARRTDPSPGGMLVFAPAGGGLPGARREVRTLASRYRGTERLDSTLTLTNLVRHSRDHGIIHVASHVRINSERPWHSGIQVGPDPPGAQYLHASEIAASDFRGHLVVLSGCESALGRAVPGEGVLGMTSAFLAAGARAVVASLWKVDDRTTVDLMIAFYGGLEAGLPAGPALRAAQLSVRSRQPAPFYWAGFVVVGDAGAGVPLDRNDRPRILMVLLTLGLLALAGAGARRWRRRNAPGL